MTTYTAITSGEIDPDSPITNSLMTKLRDNPIAITEGASGAPKIQTAAIDDLAVTAAKLASNAVTTAKITDGNVTLAKLSSGIIPVRAWCVFDADSPSIVDDENVTSVSAGSSGRYTLTFTTAFANATYAGAGMPEGGTGTPHMAHFTGGTYSTTQFEIFTSAIGGASPDYNFLIFAGDQ